ncbi:MULTISPECIES: hypothetical protein [Streptomyces]|uniref:hypothetical protein n=1 Tax=Streptomyces TaxID=1883 RepID=UPI001902D8F2|nr:hypothetical protein [Streptomyces sp. XC 2026]QQN79728.1 hypothetical protein IPZ77_21620 [Streptomyces sp. XC 2026]QQN80664.1 hypothetical protein IPZ77_27035 [Streptomyces sp. XC 2026]
MGKKINNNASTNGGTVVQTGNVSGGVHVDNSTTTNNSGTVINQPSGPVNTGDGAQIVTIFSKR